MGEKTRIVIIGWDGATFDVANPLLEQGKLPNLKRLMEMGSSGRLRSTIPPLFFGYHITKLLE